MFALYQKGSETPMLNESGGVKLFPTGRLAKAFVEENTERLNALFPGVKWVPKRYTSPDADASWKKREKTRLENGTYARVLPSLEVHCKPEHFVHMSRRNPEQLAYTRNSANGANDTQSPISVVGYLEAYAPSVTRAEREQLATEHLMYALGVAVKFAKTPDEIESVYTNYDSGTSGVCDSCMRYKHGGYGEEDEDGDCEGPYFTGVSEHPVRAYGAGDLAIAYLENERGETVARCLCWPEKKVYGRMYGESRLHDLLRKMGYRKAVEYYGNEGWNEGATFEGARVLRIKNKKRNYENYVILPYFDFGRNSGVAVHEDERYFTVTKDYDMEAQSTSGYVQLRIRKKCPKCGTRHNSGYQVNTAAGVQEWCSSCTSRHAQSVEGDYAYYARADFTFIEIDGYRYEKTYVERTFKFCTHCNKWTRHGLTEVLGKNSETLEMCSACVSRRAFKDLIEGLHYTRDQAIPSSLHKDYDSCAWVGIHIENIHPRFRPDQLQVAA